MEIRLKNPGGLSSNSYLLTKGRKAVLVDAGTEDPYPVIAHYVESKGLDIVAVLLTHAHFDHIIGLSSLSPKCPIYVGKADEAALFDARLNGSRSFGFSYKLDDGFEVRSYPEDGNLEIEGWGNLKVIATPFHTPGSVCLHFPKEKALFTGDTLFARGIGRTDLPGGSPFDVDPSLSKLEMLDPATTIYPGHGGSGKLGEQLDFALRVFCARTREI